MDIRLFSRSVSRPFARRSHATMSARGFTLTELLTAVAIMGILGAVASPNLSAMIDSQRARSASSDLFTALLRARSEAVRGNTQIVVTPVDPNKWEAGWSVSNPASAAALLNHEPVPNTTIGGPERVVYLGNGRVSGSALLSFAVGSGRTERCVKLDLSGRPTQLKQACPVSTPSP